MSEEYYSNDGSKVNTTEYPDFAGTRYKNWDIQKDIEKRRPHLYNRKEECCGCYACYSICPKGAIDMFEDLEGFVYPSVDLEKCVKCYQCEKVCPIKTSKKRPQQI